MPRAPLFEITLLVFKKIEDSLSLIQAFFFFFFLAVAGINRISPFPFLLLATHFKVK